VVHGTYLDAVGQFVDKGNVVVGGADYNAWPNQPVLAPTPGTYPSNPSSVEVGGMSIGGITGREVVSTVQNGVVTITINWP
jgi:hypothetical protein